MQYAILGGAGFIGSYIADHLLQDSTNRVIVYDNFTAGKYWHLAEHNDNDRLQVLANDIYDAQLNDALSEADVAVMLASNPDIAKAAVEPDIDFRQGTALVQMVLEAMRKGKCRRLLYASGSGVYGDAGEQYVNEDYSPMLPISTYGASKLAGEALICSYCHLFDFTASAFRFGNVVGGRQTHGVAYDFIAKLRKDPLRLEILGDGSQSKPYVHVTDVISALFLALDRQKKEYDVYNVAPDDFVTVRDIACMVVEEMGIEPKKCSFTFGKTNRGWKGDVPIVRLNTERIQNLGWRVRYNSKDAVRTSIRDMLIIGDRLHYGH